MTTSGVLPHRLGPGYQKALPVQRTCSLPGMYGVVCARYHIIRGPTPRALISCLLHFVARAQHLGQKGRFVLRIF